MQLVRWDVARDTFEPGQWLRGRVYEKRSDLSPDGSKLIYFAHKISGRTLADREYTSSWTAVSRPPFFTALALWPKGDCWNGGGLFETDTRVWLNHFASQATPHRDHPPLGVEVVGHATRRGEDATVLDRRLARDGLRLRQEWRGRFEKSAFARAYDDMIGRGLTSDEMLTESLSRRLYLLDTTSRYVTEAPQVHEKPHPSGGPTLEMTMELRGFRALYTFALRGGGGPPELADAEWADWDQRGRLAFAAQGKVLAAEPAAPGAWSARVLADLDPHEPRPEEAPPWAGRW